MAEIPVPANRPAIMPVLAFAGDTWPERVIAADLIDEELGAGGMHLVAKASEPIRMHRASAAA